MRKGEGVKMSNQEMYDAIDSVYQYLLVGGCDKRDRKDPSYRLFKSLEEARAEAYCFVIQSWG
jgi:hypothetical protein